MPHYNQKVSTGQGYIQSDWREFPHQQRWEGMFLLIV